jgi:basic membrane lipoprotein Med (substrate-binding protein (PBP1-ABC) superfamily)
VNRLRNLTRELRHHPKTSISAAAALITAAVIIIVVAVSGSPAPSQQIAYTNISRNFKACLLNTTTNVTTATATWQAIQKATTNTPINAQHITAPAGPTPTLVPYLNGLLALHCQLIVTTGDDLHDTLNAIATAHPQQAFLNISNAPTTLTNIHTIPTSTPPVTITNLVTTAAHKLAGPQR